MQDSITVVIPLYNKVNDIKKAIDSVFAQTKQPLEIIVIDDGSTDGGAGVVAAIEDTRLHLICQRNAGVSVARNKGIKEAKGNLIAFLDADDEWKPSFLERILTLRVKFPKAGLYATSYQLKYTEEMVIPNSVPSLPRHPWQGIISDYFEIAIGAYPVWSSAVTIPKSIFYDVGFFPEGERLGEDQDMWVRIALQYDIAYTTEVCAIYHLDADNRACKVNLLLDLPFIRRLEEKINQGLIADKYINSARKYIVYHQLRIAENYIKRKERVAALKQMLHLKYVVGGGVYVFQFWLKLWIILIFPSSIVKGLQRLKTYG